MPIFMKDDEIHVSGPAEGPKLAEGETGEVVILGLHEPRIRFEYPPMQGGSAPEGETD